MSVYLIDSIAESLSTLLAYMQAENAMEKLKIKVWNWSNMMVIQK